MQRRTRLTAFLGALLAAASLSAGAQGIATDCAGVKEANPAAGDGDYYIAPGGKLFQVYCHDMAGNPREYLTLVNTAPGANYSLYGNVGGGPPANVTTRYTRIRIDPVTLLVNVADQAFATSSGFDCCIGSTFVTSMPYAHASSCWGGSDPGRANVDLTGLPFIVDDVFTVRGWGPYGSANGTSLPEDFSAVAVQAAVVDLTGAGFCGGIGPTAEGGSFNRFAGFDLQLAYTGGQHLCKDGGWKAYGLFRNQGDCVSLFASAGRNGTVD